MRTHKMVVVAIYMAIVKSHRFYFGYKTILMNTKKLWFFSVALLSTFVLAGCATTQPVQTDDRAANQEADTEQIDQSMQQEDQMESETETSEDAQEGSSKNTYQEYDEQAVEQALDDGKKVALFFHATRCPSCRALNKEINENIGELPEDSVTFKLDYDTQTQLRQQYGVTTQHTIVVIDENKEEIAKDASSADLAKLVSMLQ